MLRNVSDIYRVDARRNRRECQGEDLVTPQSIYREKRIRHYNGRNSGRNSPSRSGSRSQTRDSACVQFGESSFSIYH